MNAGQIDDFDAQKISVEITAIDNDGLETTRTIDLLFESGVFSGYAIDGYVVGATVFFDENKNGILDPNEPSTTTDKDGFYKLDFLNQLASFDDDGDGQIDPEEGSIRVIGGLDSSTGLLLETSLRATPYASVVTSLTTLVADLVDGGMTELEARQAVANALGLPAGVDVNYFDPIEATLNNEIGGVETLKATAKVQNVITMVAGLFAGITGHSSGVDECGDGAAINPNYINIVNQVTQAIATEINSTGFNLDSTATLTNIINSVATALGVSVGSFVSGTIDVIIAANDQINGISSTGATAEEEIAKVQKVALGQTTDELESATSATIGNVVTNNTGSNLISRINSAIVNSADPTDIDIIPRMGNAFIDPDYAMANPSNPNEIINVYETGTLGAAAGFVGTFTSTDSDTLGLTDHHYCFVSGEGDDDNNKFEIIKNGSNYELRLKSTEVFDYETQHIYSIRVQSIDGDGGIYQEALRINVISKPEPTTNVYFSDSDVLIGEDQGFFVTFDNTADPNRGNVGYRPFIDLFLDTSGDDNDGGILDGISLVGDLRLITADNISSWPTLSSLDRSLQTRTVNADGMIDHPYAGMIKAPTGFGEGDTLVTVLLPQDGLAPAQPTVTLYGTVNVSNKADYNSPLKIASRGGFRYGPDPILNEGDPVFKEGTTSTNTIVDQTDDISPHLFRLYKYGPYLPIVTGPNYTQNYGISLNIAPGQTIDSLDLKDQLADNVQYLSSSPTPVTLNPTNGLGSLVTANYNNATGNINQNLGFYIPRLDKNGNYVINPTTGAASSSSNNAIVTANTWTPLDTTDPTLSTLTEDDLDIDWSHTNSAIAIQKSYSLVTDNLAPGFSPGDVIEYTLNFQISDYFAFDNVKIFDTFSDGQQLVSGFAPTLTLNEHNITLTPTLNFTPSGNTLTFNVNDGVDNRLLGGRIDDANDSNGNGVKGFDPALTFGATTGTIKFRTVIQEDFTGPVSSGDISVDVGDYFNNVATISGNILDVDDDNIGTLFASGNQISSSGGTGFYLNQSYPNNYKATVYGIDRKYYNNDPNSSYPNRTEVLPGDEITYRIKYQIPFEDIENLKFESVLPLPVFHVKDLLGAAITPWSSLSLQSAGSISYGPEHTFTAPSPAIIINQSANSITFDYGDYDKVASSGPATIDLLFTLKIGSEPTDNGLLLTNFVYQDEGRSNTYDRSPWLEVSQLKLIQPELKITKGVVAFTTSQTGVTLSQALPSGISFTAPNTSGVRFTEGNITSAIPTDQRLNSNLIGTGSGSGVVPGDLVTFAITLENIGTSANGAFDVLIKDILPQGFKVPTTTNGLNLRVTDGTGTIIHYEKLGGGPDQLDHTDDDLFGNGIRLVDPPLLTSPPTVTGAIAAYNATSGKNIAIITFDLQVTSPVTSGQVITSNAILEEYSNVDGGDKFLASILAVEEPASVTIGASNKPPYFNDAYLGTTLLDQDGNTTNGQFVLNVPSNLFFDLEDDAVPTPLMYEIDTTNVPGSITVTANPDGTPNSFILSGSPSSGNDVFPIIITATDSGGLKGSRTVWLETDPNTQEIYGTIIDSYIGFADVFYDANNNGIQDAGEPFTQADGKGNYELDIPTGSPTDGTVVVKAGRIDFIDPRGFDVTTGLILGTHLRATPDTTTVSLLTTLIADLVVQGSTTVATANTEVVTALGLPSGVDINHFDPILATNAGTAGGVETFAAMVKVQNVITQIAGLLDGASSVANDQIVNNVVRVITDQIKSGTVFNFINTTQLANILSMAADKTGVTTLSGIYGDVATVIASANQLIDDLVVNSPPNTLEEEFAKVQKVALGETTNDLKKLGAGAKSISDVLTENTVTFLSSHVDGPEVGVPYFNWTVYRNNWFSDQDSDSGNDDYVITLPKDLFLDLEDDKDDKRLTYNVTGLPPGITVEPADPMTYPANSFKLSGFSSTNSTNQYNGNEIFNITITATDSDDHVGSRSVVQLLINPNTRGISGFNVDGYIAGATVFFDVNNNGQLDQGEFSTITGENGFYSLGLPVSLDLNNNGQLDPDEGTIVGIGGVDIATGLPLATPVKATPDATILSLLTTLVADLVDQGLTVDEANSQVTNALFLPANVSLNHLDPILATNNNQYGGVETFAAMVQVQTVITQIAGLINGASPASNADIVNNVVSAITSQIQAGSFLNLMNTTQLKTIIDSAATSTGVDVSSLSAQVAQVIAAANQQINTLVATLPPQDLENAFAKVQKVALGKTTEDLEQVGAGTKSIAQVVTENTGTGLQTKITNAIVDSASPTDIVLSNNTIAENVAIGTEVGQFTSVDPSTGENYTYLFVSGVGDKDNDKFKIVGDRLFTKDIFDYETQNTYSVRVLTSDGNGGVYSEAITLNISDVNEINGTPGRDTLTGTNNDDIIAGFGSNDTLRGNGGKDQFVYTSLGDATDIIKDFTVGQDKIVLTQLLRGLGYNGSNPIADGYVRFKSNAKPLGSFVQIDTDGFAGSSSARNLIFTENVPLAALSAASNFVF